MRILQRVMATREPPGGRRRKIRNKSVGTGPRACTRSRPSIRPCGPTRDEAFLFSSPSIACYITLTLSSGEAAYRRAKFAPAAEMCVPILRYGAYAPTQDEGSGRLPGMRAQAFCEARGRAGDGCAPTEEGFFNNPKQARFENCGITGKAHRPRMMTRTPPVLIMAHRPIADYGDEGDLAP